MVGTRLAHYEITAHLGSGGMGEVYQAVDLRLKRSVAIKVLPDTFASDAERLSRFQREAQLLASLNHANIAQIYGLEESGQTRCIVMELVDGETLAQRLKRGPIPPGEALTIARQIAEALEAAHEKGVIHRDLKPGNVMLTNDGKVKVLDFGLAKAFEAYPANASLSNSPTMLSTADTNAGMILGTAAYMSPEQAKGRAVDKRTDIFAFGCVLFEMLTGKPAFDGEDIAEILSLVLQREPDWNLLPSSVPLRVRELLRLCLEKNPKNRRSDATDVRLDIEQALKEPDNTPLPVLRPTRLAWTAVLVILIIISAITTFLFYERGLTNASKAEAIRLFISAPEKTAFVSPNTASAVGRVSPDGQRLVFSAKDATGKTLLWIRLLDSFAAKPLPGTDDAGFPFWSADSQWVAFFAQGKLKKVDIGTGLLQVLCDAPEGRGGTWNREGTIVFAPTSLTGLNRVSSAGGEPVVLTKPGPGQTSHRFPFFLPDGHHFVYFASGPPEVSGIYISALDSSDSRRLLASDSAAVYARPGYLLFVRQGTLLAQPFDAIKLTAGGDPVRLVDSIPADVFGSAFSVSDTGVLTYRQGQPTQDLQLAWYDRAGKLLETVGPPGKYVGVDLSPDGTRIAVHRHDSNGGDIWVFEPRGTITRLTFDASEDNSMPIWSPDGNQIAFCSLRNGKWGIYQKASNGSGVEQLLVESELPKVPMAWAPDGKAIVYTVIDPTTSADQWILPLSGERKPIPLLNTPLLETHTQISPNGNWMAYFSNQAGQYEVYVKPFPTGDGKWQISTNGGSFPRWRADGKEIFYFSLNVGGKVMAAKVNGGGNTFNVVGAPEALFETGYVSVNHPGSVYYHPYAVSPDGQRFLIPRPAANLQGESEATPITVVLNWIAMLKK